jgi:hypothetical protein
MVTVAVEGVMGALSNEPVVSPLRTRSALAVVPSRASPRAAVGIRFSILGFIVVFLV